MLILVKSRIDYFVYEIYTCVLYSLSQQAANQTCRYEGKYHEQNDTTRTCLPKTGYLINLTNLACRVAQISEEFSITLVPLMKSM